LVAVTTPASVPPIIPETNVVVTVAFPAASVVAK